MGRAREGKGQKKTLQGIAATIHLLCQSARQKSHDGKMGEGCREEIFPLPPSTMFLRGG
jgi:hypothetical protein